MAKTVETMAAEDTLYAKNDGRPWWRWIALGLLILLGLILLGVVGGYLFLRSGAGLRFIEDQVSGQSFGPVAGLEIEGMEGNVFDALTIDRIGILDKNGEWVIIEGLEVDYTVFSLKDRHVDIQSLQIDRVEVLRRPELDGPTDGEPIRTTIERFVVNEIVLREPAIGQEAVLSAEGAFNWGEGGAVDLELRAERIDVPEGADGETLVLDFDRTADGTMTGIFDVAAPAGGAIPALLQAGDVDVRGSGKIAGTVERGGGEVVLNFGTREVVDAVTEWTPERATVRGVVDTRGWTMMEAVSSRVGERVEIAAELNRNTRGFTADATADSLRASTTGVLPEDGFVPETAKVDVRSTAPQALLGLPEGFRLGEFRANGDVRVGDAQSFDGTVELRTFVSPYLDAGTIRAPLRATRNADGTIDLSTDARVRELITKQSLPVDLAQEALIEAVLRLEPEAQRVIIRAFALESGAQSATASGTLRYGDGMSYDLSGSADVKLNTLGAVPPGELIANFDVQSVEGLALPAVTAEGAFVPTGEVAGPVAEIIGERVAFDVAMEPEGEALRITKGLVAGEKLNAAVTGYVGDTLDLSGEARLTEVIRLPQAELGAGAEASFAISGARADPNVRVDADVPNAIVSGQTMENVRLRADVSDVLSNPRGPVQLEANTAYGPVTASATLASVDGQYAATDIRVNAADVAGGLALVGDVEAVGGGLYGGRLALELPRDGSSYGEAVVELAPVNGVQGVKLMAEARNVAAFGYDIAELDAQASGTLERLTGTLSVKGREDALIARQLIVETPLTLVRDNGVYRAELSPEGKYGALRFAPRGVVKAEYGNGRLMLDVPMEINDGTLDLDYLREGTAETLQAAFDAIPLQTLPLPAGLGETQGILTGEARFGSAPGQAPSGNLRVELSDWRGRLVEAGEGISLVATGALLPDRFTMKLEDGDRTPFDIQGQARVSLLPSSTLSGLRPAMDGPLTARLRADGDAGVMFNLFAPEDSNPEGTLDIELSAAGTLNAPRFNGTASGRAIRFEAPVAGTQVRNARFAASFTCDSVTISEVFANDSDDGTLSGQGEFALAGTALTGELNLRADSFRALDRKDYEGRVDGTVSYVSTAQAGTVTGDLKLDRAEVKQFATGRAKVVELIIDEVVGERDHQNRIEVPRTVIPIRLDVKLRAPRRIFIRARGIDLEAALDITIKGTVSEPLIFGTAEALRGGITLAGKELEFDEGEITFNGPIPNAVINLEATAQTPTLTATVAVTGTVDAPEIKLSSQPERPDDEILSALLFGRSATQLSALEAAQLAGALATLSGSGGGFNLVGGLRDALGFNSLDIGVDEDGNPLLSGGRYLAKNVYLELFSGSNSSASGAVISWEVRDNVVLRTQVASDNEQAFAVLYKRDF